MLSARKQLDVITAYRQVGTYRGAAEMCGLTHKTVKRIIEKVEAAEQRVARRKNYESVRALVAQEISETKGKISAKRLPPKAHAAGYAGSARNFRRLVAQERAKYRQHQAIARARRPGVWTPRGASGHRLGSAQRFACSGGPVAMLQILRRCCGRVNTYPLRQPDQTLGDER